MEHGFVLLVGDTVAPSGLYARLCHAFLVNTLMQLLATYRVLCILFYYYYWWLL